MSYKPSIGNNKPDLRSSFHSSKYSGNGNRRQNPSAEASAYGSSKSDLSTLYKTLIIFAFVIILINRQKH